MKIRRTVILWLSLTLCAATVIGALSWLTRSVLAAESARLTAQRDRATAEARADLEERTRLALWRMDALGAAMVLRENLVPADFYQAPDPSRPPPATGPEFQVRFQLAKDRSLNALPADPTRGDRVQRLQALLAEHPPECDEWTNQPFSVYSVHRPSDAVSPAMQSMQNAAQRLVVPADQLRKDANYQQGNNFNELNQRAKAVQQTVNGNLAQADIAENEPAPGAAQAADEARGPSPPSSSPADPVVVQTKVTWTKNTGLPNYDMLLSARNPPTIDDVGQMRAVWLGSELLLLRKVTHHPSSRGESIDQWFNFGNSYTVLQGVWLDSQALTAKLLREIADLLPQARLVPTPGASAATDPLALVSFPFRLERGESPLATAIPTTPSLGGPLWVAWGGVALAILTSALLVRSVLRLSERRASFVSAVTHELRTPLTTFRLYSDMLESGAVKEEKRGSYLRVLSREADRLSHLVENVLAFSRIERGNARSNVREAEVAGLLESFRERLESRLATAGLTLTLTSAPAVRIRADIAAVEHILFNLIDNAAKYAAQGNPRVVDICVDSEPRWVAIHVSDHGPGVPVADRCRIFQAFHKSAREAAESQPGVGLGLALSRRLACEQGGALVLAESTSGACFILRLPRVRE
jgi:signal transduction histidine kinase